MTRWLDKVQAVREEHREQRERAREYNVFTRKHDALASLLEAQRKAHQPDVLTAGLWPGEGNLGADVGITVWAPDHAVPMNWTSPLFAYCVKEFRKVGIEFDRQVWMTPLRKFALSMQQSDEAFHEGIDVSFFYREMDVISPKAVLVCGSQAVRAIFGEKTTLVSAVGHTKMVQHPVSGQHVLYIATYLPSQAMANHQMGVDFAHAVARAWEQTQHAL